MAKQPRNLTGQVAAITEALARPGAELLSDGNSSIFAIPVAVTFKYTRGSAGMLRKPHGELTAPRAVGIPGAS